VSVPLCRASKESILVFKPLSEFIIYNYNIDYNDIYIGVEKKVLEILSDDVDNFNKCLDFIKNIFKNDS